MGLRLASAPAATARALDDRIASYVKCSDGTKHPPPNTPVLRRAAQRTGRCNRLSADPRYRARTYRQTCAPLLALAVDSSVNGIAFPSSAKIVFPPPRMIGSIVSNNSSTRSAASNDRTIVALPYT